MLFITVLAISITRANTLFAAIPLLSALERTMSLTIVVVAEIALGIVRLVATTCAKATAIAIEILTDRANARACATVVVWLMVSTIVLVRVVARSVAVAWLIDVLATRVKLNDLVSAAVVFADDEALRVNATRRTNIGVALMLEVAVLVPLNARAVLAV
jgi:hypothetical protein